MHNGEITFVGHHNMYSGCAGLVIMFILLAKSASENAPENGPAHCKPPHKLTSAEFQKIWESEAINDDPSDGNNPFKPALDNAEDEPNKPKKITHMDALELIKQQGYEVTAYDVRTEDGYWLTLFRMGKLHPPGTTVKQSKLIAYLQHGLFGTACHFLMDKAENSLRNLFIQAFKLVDNGYDVWLGNARGSFYSRRHDKLDCHSPEFWKFSFHEIALKDITASIDFIWEKTGKQHKIYYIGHSMGGLVALIKCSRFPEWAAEKIEMFIGLAPASYVNSAKNGFHHYKGHEKVEQVVAEKVLFAGKHTPTAGKTMAKIASTFCAEGSWLKITFLCKGILYLATSYNIKHVDNTRLHMYLRHAFGGASKRTIVHFGQMTLAQRPQEFDLREDRTTGKAPEKYDFTKFAVPTVLFTGLKDKLIVQEDVELLKRDIAPVLRAHYVFEEAGHTDFLSGLYAPKFVYNRVLLEMQNYQAGTSKSNPGIPEIVKGDL